MSPELMLKPLLGKTITGILNMEPNSGNIQICLSDGSIWTLYHSQDCCECVQVHSIVGVRDVILNSPVVFTNHEELYNQDPPGCSNDGAESWTWTIFTIATEKGSLVIRWLGESNGYYGETVDFVNTTPAQ